MKIKSGMVAGLLAISMGTLAAGTASAADSVQNASAVSVAGSLVTASVAGWIAYEGSTLTVKAVQASGDGVILLLEGASGAVQSSAKIANEAARSASVGVGTAVSVVAESTGYALVASGVLIAFVPNEIGRALLHSSRY